MDAVQKELILYGIKDHQRFIDQVIQDLNIEVHDFEVRLLLVESIMNAYYHGNCSDCEKPIHIRYLLIDKLLHLEIEDCGDGEEGVVIPEELDDDMLLCEGGRGLFLIGCFADSVEIIQNTIHINKTLLGGSL